MVKILIEMRQVEPSFAAAWRRAEDCLAARDVRPPHPPVVRESSDEDEGWMPFSVFFKRACAREWTGTATWDVSPLLASDGPVVLARRRSKAMAA